MRAGASHELRAQMADAFLGGSPSFAALEPTPLLRHWHPGARPLWLCVARCTVFSDLSVLAISAGIEGFQLVGRKEHTRSNGAAFPNLDGVKPAERRVCQPRCRRRQFARANRD